VNLATVDVAQCVWNVLAELAEVLENWKVNGAFVPCLPEDHDVTCRRKQGSPLGPVFSIEIGGPGQTHRMMKKLGNLPKHGIGRAHPIEHHCLFRNIALNSAIPYEDFEITPLIQNFG
jgi:hypothetical protein